MKKRRKTRIENNLTLSYTKIKRAVKNELLKFENFTMGIAARQNINDVSNFKNKRWCLRKLIRVEMMYLN